MGKPENELAPVTRRSLGEVAVLATLAGCVGAACVAVGLGILTGDIGVAATILFVGAVGGALFAVVASYVHAALGPPDPQRLDRHPGWYGYGPVGGVGATLALIGLLVTVVLRAPTLFLPVLAVVIPAGAATALLIRRMRSRPQPTLSIKSSPS
jgi:hypothetical protein